MSPVGSGGGVGEEVGEAVGEVLKGLLDILPKLEDVLKGSSGTLLPSSSSNESGARVQAGASEVIVLVSVWVVVVSKP